MRIEDGRRIEFGLGIPMKLYLITGSLVISLCLLLAIPLPAASLNCRIVETQGKGVKQEILNQMKDMSGPINVGAATLNLVGTIGGGRLKGPVLITGAAVSVIGAVFSAAETFAEPKQELCEFPNKPGNFIMASPGAAEQFARDRPAVFLPPSQRPLGSSNFSGMTGLHFTEKGIDAVRNRCKTCSVRDILQPPDKTKGQTRSEPLNFTR